MPIAFGFGIRLAPDRCNNFEITIITKNTFQLSNQYKVTARSVSGHCQVSARSVPGQCQVSARSVPGQCQVSTRSMPGQCQVTARSLPGHWSAKSLLPGHCCPSLLTRHCCQVNVRSVLGQCHVNASSGEVKQKCRNMTKLVHFRRKYFSVLQQFCCSLQCFWRCTIFFQLSQCVISTSINALYWAPVSDMWQ